MSSRRTSSSRVFHVVLSLLASLTFLAATASLAQVPPVQFAPVVSYTLGGYRADSVAIGDVNGDGKPDLAVASEAGAVLVLVGNGDGTFRAPVSYSSGGYTTTSVGIVDVNGDGRPDLIVVNSDGTSTSNGYSTVGVLMGNGDGTFQAVVSYSCGFHGSSVAIGDLNGDGKTDLVVANMSQNLDLSTVGGVSVLLGNGDGTFQKAVGYGSGGFRPVSVAIGDLNGDGKTDLAVANSCSSTFACNGGEGSVAVLLGNGDGTFQAPFIYSTANNPSSVAMGDLNGDGKPDLVVATVLLLGNGDGTFQAPVSYTDLSAESVAIGDLNGDGKPDLAVTHQCGYSCGTRVSALLGNGDGTFEAPINFRAGGFGGAVAPSVAIADVNADRRPDLVVANLCADYVCVNGSVGVLLNKTFYATTTTLVSSLDPSMVEQPVTFTATVTCTKGTIPDGELVMYYDGTAALGSVALARGTATYTTSSLSVKSHSIKATYVGDITFKSSSRTVQQIVNLYPTTTTLSTSPNPSNYGGSVSLTAQVTVSSSTARTGKVTFKNGTTGLGTVTVNTNGVATLTKTTLPVGSDVLTATYNGDSVNGKSTSPPVTQIVNQAHITVSLSSSPNP